MANKNSNLKQFSRVGRIFQKELSNVKRDNTNSNTLLNAHNQSNLLDR